MKNVNLIPAPRREAKLRQRRRRVCMLACGGYAMALALAVGGAHLFWNGSAGGAGGESVDARLAATDGDVKRLERQSDEVRTELLAARATIEANRTVAEQPDWSILLSLLARLTGEDVVLRSIAVGPPPGAQGSSPAKAAPPEVVLEVAGIGRTPLSVSRHVLKLEGTGLFAKVVLLDHSREAYLNDHAIAFRVQCTFGEPSPQRQALSSVGQEGVGR